MFQWCGRVWLVGMALLCALTVPSSGQTAAPTAPSAATSPAASPKTLKDLVARATQRFGSGDFSGAIEDYRAAYQLKPLPTLLFNIAQAYRKNSQWPEALTSFERFIKEDPKSTLIPEAEAQAAAMRAKIDAERATAERATAEQVAKQRADEAEALAKVREEERKKAEAALLLATQKKEPVYKRPWFWGVMAGVAAIGVGTAIGVGLYMREPASDLGGRTVGF